MLGEESRGWQSRSDSINVPADSKGRDFDLDLADQSHLSVSSLQPRVTLGEEGRGWQSPNKSMKIPADSKVRDFGLDLADQSHLS